MNIPKLNTELELDKEAFKVRDNATRREIEKEHPYEVGKIYHCRTVTYATLGKLKAVYKKELVFKDASWVADTGRFNEYLKDTSKAEENEPSPKDIIVNRDAIVDIIEVDAVNLNTQ